MARVPLSTALAERLADAPRLDKERFRAIANEVKAQTGQKGKALFHPIRIALTGRAEGPELDLAIPAIDRGADLPASAGLPKILGCRERAAAFVRRWSPERADGVNGTTERETTSTGSERHVIIAAWLLCATSDADLRNQSRSRGAACRTRQGGACGRARRRPRRGDRARGGACRASRSGACRRRTSIARRAAAFTRASSRTCARSTRSTLRISLPAAEGPGAHRRARRHRRSAQRRRDPADG